MARRPDGASARTEFLRVRITAGGLEKIDKQRRPGESRSAYIRRLIAQDGAK